MKITPYNYIMAYQYPANITVANRIQRTNVILILYFILLVSV